MRKVSKVQYKIDGDVLKNYVEAINSIKAPMSQIKEQLNQLSESKEELNKALNESMKLVIEESGATFRAYNPMMDQLKKIHTMANQIKELIIKYPNDHAKIYIDIMKQIMCANHGMLSVRMIEPLNISRQYLSIMENK